MQPTLVAISVPRLEVSLVLVVEADLVALARVVVRAVAVAVAVEALRGVVAVRVIPVVQLTQPYLTACQLRPVVHIQLV
jgi:hypothetical protein